MGEFGSGGWADYYNRKITVEQCKAISTKTLREYGFFADNISGEIVWRNDFGDKIGAVNVRSVLDSGVNNRIVITGKSVVSHSIELSLTACNFGGLRYWFLCPAVKDGVYCGNRVTKLYLPSGGKIFGCRQCYDLTYQSCQENHKYDNIFNHIDEFDIDEMTITQALRLGKL